MSISRTPFGRWLFFVFALGLMACDVPPPQTKWPDITYTHRPSIVFDVADIAVETIYAPSLEPPHVEHLMPAPPAGLAARWARDRLVAGGARNRMVYRIFDASVVETGLQQDEGLKEYFTVAQSERYDARLEVEVELIEDDGGRASVKVSAERSITVPEDSSLSDREKVWFELSETVMNDLDAELEKAFRKHMAAHILN